MHSLDMLYVLAALSPDEVDMILRRLPPRPRRGRPWSGSRRLRLLVTCAALRTNLTLRELAAVMGMSKSGVHRVVRAMMLELAALAQTGGHDRRFTWVVDGTLVPTRDHTCAAKSKNYRYSCNAQILIRRRDLRVMATSTGGPGNRNDVVHYRGSRIEELCRAHGRVLADGGYRGVAELITPRFRNNRIVRNRHWRAHRRRRARAEHAIARLKDWRILRDHRRRGSQLSNTLQAVAALHNLRLDYGTSLSTFARSCT